MVKKKQELELTIEQSAFGGKGLTRLHGLAVFVDQTVPGDRVLARIVKKKKNFAEARMLQLLEPSAHRVTPPCKYSGYCGGCKWQFLSYDVQLLYKQQHVRESLEHIGLLTGVVVHPTLPTEPIFGYRNKMEFSCATRRWLLPEELTQKDIDAGIGIGLHVPGTFDKVIDIEYCLLQHPLGNDLLSEIRRHIKASNLPIYHLRDHQGFWRYLVLRRSVAYDQWMVNLVTSADQRIHLQPLAQTLMQKYPNVVSVINNITSRKAGVAVGEYEIQLAGQPYLLDRIGHHEFEISANSFFQTNTHQAESLYNVVNDYAGLTGDETVLDLYCGAGTIAIHLSGMSKAVIGIEAVESAVADAKRNSKRNAVQNCRFICGDIRTSLTQIQTPPDIIVTDPPRSGMHQDVITQILSLKPKRIVYVSCNPATMARDILPLKEDYSVAQVQPVDMFPHTFHIESVAQLIRR